MFNIHYDLKTGEVKSYQEGPDVTPDDQIPVGCGVLSVTSSEGMFDGSSLAYSVDPSSKQLVPLKTPKIVGA